MKTPWSFLLASILFGLLTAACAWLPSQSQETTDSKLLTTHQLEDGSILFKYKNGASCAKRADYTRNINTSGALAIKHIFEVRGNINEYWDNAKQYDPKFEQLAAVFFDICEQYGEEHLSEAQYKEQWDKYNALRTKLLGGALIEKGKFSEDPTTPGGKAIKEYYSWLDYDNKDKGYCNAWGLLSKAKQKYLETEYGWTTCEAFGQEGFRTTERHEHVLIYEGSATDSKYIIDEILIVVDNFPANRAKSILTERTAKEVLSQATLSEITSRVLHDIPQQYDVTLTQELLQWVTNFIENSRISEILSPDLLEVIALKKDRTPKDFVFPIKKKGPTFGFGNSSTQRTRQLIINRRDVVLEDGKWRLGSAKTLAVGLFGDSQ